MADPGGPALYVVVVVDHRTGSTDSYGPLTDAAALTTVLDLRALLFNDRITDVSVTTARLHSHGAPEHPDDP